MNKKKKRLLLKSSNIGLHPITRSAPRFMHPWNLICFAALYYSTKLGCVLHCFEHYVQMFCDVAIKVCKQKEVDIAPVILWFVTRRWVFSFTLRPFYLREKNLCYPFSTRLCRPQRKSERFEKEIIWPFNTWARWELRNLNVFHSAAQMGVKLVRPYCSLRHESETCLWVSY